MSLVLTPAGSPLKGDEVMGSSSLGQQSGYGQQPGYGQQSGYGRQTGWWVAEAAEAEGLEAKGDHDWEVLNVR
jgi:hypothetical protein